MPTSPITYPASLPCPQELGSQSAERRVLAPDDGPFRARPGQRDRHDFETIAFPPFNAAQAATFDAWFAAAGYSWFSATWPSPQGFGALARRFVEPPTWRYLGGGFWRVTAQLEVRGVGDAPVAYLSDCGTASDALLLAMTEIGKVMLWRSGEPSSQQLIDNAPIFGTYHNRAASDGIDNFPAFPITMSVDWNDLLLPSGVSVLGGTRSGGWPANTTSLTLNVTNFAQSYPAPLCRACVFITAGSWLGTSPGGEGEGVACPVTIPQAGQTIYPKWFANGGGGNAIAAAVFLLRNKRGRLSVIDVAHA